MIYVPVDIRGPIAVKKSINIQSGLTNNFPEIVFELHSDYEYVDLGDDCQLSAAVTNFDLESVVFSGDLEIMNPHRGQILCKLNYNDFSKTGINTLTIRCACEDFDISFQTTVFVQSISNGLLNCL
jgi:hypothetical protein